MINAHFWKVTVTFFPDCFTKAHQQDGDEEENNSNDSSNDCS